MTGSFGVGRHSVGRARLAAVLAACAAAWSASAGADTVPSVDQIEKHLKTPEAREFFAEQMQGKPAPDALGVHLPDILPAGAITRLLVPSTDTAAPSLIGARSWPGQPDLYVAIVCTGGTGSAGKDPQCARAAEGETAPPLHVYLGVIKASATVAPHLIAASGPVNGAISWRDSGLPQQPEAADEAHGRPIQPDRFDRFDLAPYRITADQPAFGLRTAWMEGYSGGSAWFTGQLLFTVEGDRLKRVLAVPMSDFSDVAGDWHKDQTRGHDVTDAANVIVVSSHVSDGHFDLIVKGRSGSWKRFFRWNPESGTYQPVAE